MQILCIISLQNDIASCTSSRGAFNTVILRYASHNDVVLIKAYLRASLILSCRML